MKTESDPGTTSTRREWRSTNNSSMTYKYSRMKADKIKQERDQAELEECTHHPTINELSKSMLKPRQPIPEHLIAQGRIIRDKIES